MAQPIYKILSKSAFEAARAKGRFDGSPVDFEDGFIHLSGGSQVAGTLQRYFTGQSGLVIVAIDPEALGEALQWEVSRGGELFPHLYGPLDLEAVLSVEELKLGEDGVHLLPAGVAA